MLPRNAPLETPVWGDAYRAVDLRLAALRWLNVTG